MSLERRGEERRGEERRGEERRGEERRGEERRGEERRGEERRGEERRGEERRGEERRKCSATVVGLDLVLWLSIVRRCSLNRTFKCHLVSPMHCKLQRLPRINEVLSDKCQVRFDGGDKTSYSVRNVRTRSTIFSTTERARKELGMDISRIRRKLVCS